MKKEKTVLYVDDEPLNLKLFEIAFMDEYNIITSDSPLTASNILDANNEISVVISDMRMPGMNGIEFITSAKQKKPDLSYFILTGYDINKEIADALNNKTIKKYFSKPFNVESIKKAINNSERTI
jgi:two-component system response regulator (stage 0 sporulation protein F)